MAPQLKKSQQKLYGNMLDISPEISLGQVIMNEGLSSLDLENNIAIAITELTKIADRTIAEYVVDRLEPSEILFLVVNLNGIVRNIRKNKSRLDKDMFIEIIQQMAQDDPIDRSTAEDDSEDAVAASAVSKKQIPLSSVGVARKEQRETLEKQQRSRNESAEEVLKRDLVNKVKIIEARNILTSKTDALLNNASPAAPTTVSRTVTPNPTQTPRISPKDKILMTSERMAAILDRSLEKSSKRRSSRLPKPKKLYDPQTGKGMIMYGRGYNLSEKSKKNRHYLNDNRFYIELHKLEENVLSVKYASTDGHIPSVKVQNISDDIKNIIEDVLKNKYNERLFQQLNPNDKRVFKRFIKGVKLDISLDDDLDKQFHKDYQILKGQFESGNTSPEIRNALKRYVIEGLAENRISKNEAHFLLYQLSL